jgi:hypothetical protein
VQLPCRICSAASPVRSEYGSGIGLLQLIRAFSDAAAARIFSLFDRNLFGSAEHWSERGQRGTIAGSLNIYIFPGHGHDFYTGLFLFKRNGLDHPFHANLIGQNIAQD